MKTPLNSIKNLRILLSPLNWGLGHVSRTIPIIEQLLAQNNEVLICCDADQEKFYRTYFPELWYIPWVGYPFYFNGKGKWTKDIVQNISLLYRHLQAEKEKVKELVSKFNPDLLISDQRFGFQSEQVRSVLLSHQLHLPVSKWNYIAQRWNLRLLASFDEIWVPDNQKRQYSGKLSEIKRKNIHFLGICSRLKENDSSSTNKVKKYRYLGIVSGPAPYHQQLFQILLSKFSTVQGDTALLIPAELHNTSPKAGNIEVLSSLSPSEFSLLFNTSEIIVSRSGYSTIMDLAQTQQKGILIPTPGQAEQIYLSHLHRENPLWDFKTENEFTAMEL